MVISYRFNGNSGHDIMIDKQYREHMEAITDGRKQYISQCKDYYRLSYQNWLCIMGLFETWDLIV